jgi:drug/metabolite transporter (DMT)-like permease
MTARNNLWLLFVALAGLAWGTYVPLIARGGAELKNSWAAFLCVGAAYFLIAVLFPVGILIARGQKVKWNAGGITFASLAGVAGAVGALCVIFATFEFNGPRLFVAPLIFATAPVVNTLVSLVWHPTPQNPYRFGPPEVAPNWKFYLGILLAGAGAGLVLASKEIVEGQAGKGSLDAGGFPWWVVFVVLAGLAWGTYVPLIAKGGKDLGSSYASLLCVGAAYFVLAVVFPVVRLFVVGLPPDKPVIWSSTTGLTLATLAGVAGAVGALCVIFATFEFKGPRLYVAPLIFSAAPVVNTVVSLLWHPTAENPLHLTLKEVPGQGNPWGAIFYAGILCAGAGAGLVLYSKEEAESKHGPAPRPAPAPAAGTAPAAGH